MYISTHSCYLCSTFIIQFFKVQINLEYVQASFFKKLFCFVAKLNRRMFRWTFVRQLSIARTFTHSLAKSYDHPLFFKISAILFDLLFLQIFWDNVLLFCIHQYSTITVLCDLTNQLICTYAARISWQVGICYFVFKKTVGVHST